MILFIKMFKDLQQNVTQFLAIFIMSFFALFVVSGLGVLDNRNIDRYLKEVNFKDLDIQGAGFTQNNINAVQLMDGIVSVDAWYNTQGTADLDKKYKMVFSFISNNRVSKMHVAEGENYTPGSSGIWLEERFAKSKNIKVGDYITIEAENTNSKEKVMGLVNCPEYIYYFGDPAMEEADYTQYGYGILDISQCVNRNGIYDKLLVDIEGVDNQINLTRDEATIIDDIGLKLNDLLDNKNIIITPKDKDEQVIQYTERVNAYSVMKYVFAFVFGMIAMIGILSTMSRLIAKQRVTIGTLKALGFGNKKVTLHYLSYTVVVVFLGCILGSIAGYYSLGDVIFDNLVYYYINPYEVKLVSEVIYLCMVLLILLTIIVSYFCSKKILKLSASQILQPEAPKDSQESWYERTYIWKKLKFATQWNVRDISKNAMRSVISILGVTACSALLFMATGFLQVLMHLPEWNYGELIVANYRITFESDTDYLEVYDYATEYKGQMVSEDAIEIMADEENVNCSMTVIDNGNCYNLQDAKGNYMELPQNGVALSAKAAVLSGLQVGDLVTWKIKGTDQSFRERISAIYKAPMVQGITISKSYYESIHGVFEPRYVYTNKTVPENIVDRTEVNSVTPCAEIKTSIENIAEASYFAVGIIVLAAIILGVVIMYNMGVMAYTEKIKDMATLKVLGFYAKDLKSIILQQNIAIAFVGMILGMPFGYNGIKQLTELWGDKTDDFIIQLTALPYVASIVGVFGIAIIVNNMIVKRIDTINMVEALKGV